MPGPAATTTGREQRGRTARAPGEVTGSVVVDVPEHDAVIPATAARRRTGGRCASASAPAASTVGRGDRAADAPRRPGAALPARSSATRRGPPGRRSRRTPVPARACRGRGPPRGDPSGCPTGTAAAPARRRRADPRARRRRAGADVEDEPDGAGGRRGAAASSAVRAGRTWTRTAAGRRRVATDVSRRRGRGSDDRSRRGRRSRGAGSRRPSIAARSASGTTWGWAIDGRRRPWRAAMTARPSRQRRQSVGRGDERADGRGGTRLVGQVRVVDVVDGVHEADPVAASSCDPALQLVDRPGARTRSGGGRCASLLGRRPATSHGPRRDGRRVAVGPQRAT